MFRPDNGDEAKADMSAEARRWWPLPAFRDPGGRNEECEASGVLLRLPMMLLPDSMMMRWQKEKPSKLSQPSINIEESGGGFSGREFRYVGKVGEIE